MRLRGQFIHGNGIMTLIIHAFPIFDEQYLRRFMIDMKSFGYAVRNLPVTDKIQVVE